MIRIKWCFHKCSINTRGETIQYSINFFRISSVSKFIINCGRRKINAIKKHITVVTDYLNWSIHFHNCVVCSKKPERKKKHFTQVIFSLFLAYIKWGLHQKLPEVEIEDKLFFPEEPKGQNARPTKSSKVFKFFSSR